MRNMKDLKEKIKGKRYGERFTFALLLCVTLSGCGSVAEDLVESTEVNLAETGAEPGTKQVDQPEESSLEREETEEGTLTEFSELPGPYQQMAMYIQEGFRIYQVEGDYRAYLGPIEEEEYYFWLEGNFFELSENRDRKFFPAIFCWRARGFGGGRNWSMSTAKRRTGMYLPASTNRFSPKIFLKRSIKILPMWRNFCKAMYMKFLLRGMRIWPFPSAIPRKMVRFCETSAYTIPGLLKMGKKGSTTIL